MEFPSCKTSVEKVYRQIIEDVINESHEIFEDDENVEVLQELKEIWLAKLMARAKLSEESKNATAAGSLEGANSSLVKSNGKPNAPTLSDNAFHAAFSEDAAASNSNALQQQQQHSIVHLTSLCSPGRSAAAGMESTSSILESLDPKCIMPVNINLTSSKTDEKRVITIHVPASAIQEHQLLKILNARLLSSIINVHPSLAWSLLQQNVNDALIDPKTLNLLKQEESPLPISMIKQNHTAIYDVTFNETLREFNLFVNADILKIKTHEGKLSKGKAKAPLNIEKNTVNTISSAKAKVKKNAVAASKTNEELENEELNSDDDITDDEDAKNLFKTENFMVCQYEKISCTRNKWKLHFNEGVMNIDGVDYVFHKCKGKAKLRSSASEEATDNSPEYY